MKNILLVFTGGTIGSDTESAVINTSKSASKKLLQMFSDQHPEPDSIHFKILQPIDILSENLNPKHWQHIISAITDEDLSLFNGVIITHGTDTLAFTAAALGLYFNRLPIPMLVVSSDLPLTQPKANGLANFLCAVSFIEQLNHSGVFVCYQNHEQSMQIYLATRLASCLQLSSDFIGIQSKAFMHFEKNTFKQLTSLPEASAMPHALKADFSHRILLIKPYPGLDYAYFNLDNVDIVLHDLFHSGTACVSSDHGHQFSLIDFIKKCQQRQIKIYLAPAIKSESVYASTKQLLNYANVEVLWNISLETAYAKLLLAYGNFQDQAAIKHFLNQNIASEYIEYIFD